MTVLVGYAGLLLFLCLLLPKALTSPKLPAFFLIHTDSLGAPPQVAPMHTPREMSALLG